MKSLLLLTAMPLIAIAPTSIGAMKWDRRVLLVSAPTETDAALATQRHIVDSWGAGKTARDVSIVEVVANRVTGATDSAAVVRQKYRLSATTFTVILIGKDGGEKVRSAKPVSAATLEKTIDAMPMRQAGER